MRRLYLTPAWTDFETKQMVYRFSTERGEFLGALFLDTIKEIWHDYEIIFKS